MALISMIQRHRQETFITCTMAAYVDNMNKHPITSPDILTIQYSGAIN